MPVAFTEISNPVIVCCFLCLRFLANIVAGEEECPKGWTLDSDSNRCIKILDTRKTYDEAVLSCQSFGAELISIRNQLEEDFVANLMRNHPGGEDSFIGINDRVMYKDWRFENGDPATWFVWGYHQPNGANYRGGQHCLIMDYPELKWHDRKCSERFWYICMREIGDYNWERNIFVLQSSSCLEDHAVYLRTPLTNGSKVLTEEDCMLMCAREGDCRFVAYGNKECARFMRASAPGALECACPTCRLYSKK